MPRRTIIHACECTAMVAPSAGRTGFDCVGLLVVTQMLKKLGPQLKDLKQGDGILLDGSFLGRKHGIMPYPKPQNMDHPTWQAK